MRKLKPYVDRMREHVRELGLYEPRNEDLIVCAARCQRMIDDLEEDVRKRGVMVQQFKYNGAVQTLTQNPNVETIRKYTAILVRCQIALGMSNRDAEECPDDLLEFMKK